MSWLCVGWCDRWLLSSHLNQMIKIIVKKIFVVNKILAVTLLLMLSSSFFYYFTQVNLKIKPNWHFVVDINLMVLKFFSGKKLFNEIIKLSMTMIIQFNCIQNKINCNAKPFNWNDKNSLLSQHPSNLRLDELNHLN